MKRRSMIVGSIAASLVGRASAEVIPLPNGAKRAFIKAPQIVKQACSEWCWAASASMIFAMHDHHLDQRVIVQRVYGNIVCAPVGAGIVISSILNAPWTDDEGQQFHPHLVAVFDAMAGAVAINNQIIVDEISANRPLIYGNTHHAMVLSQVDYLDTPMGPNILSGGVFDPWPQSPDFHLLTPPELTPVLAGGQMGYLAAVRI